MQISIDTCWFVLLRVFMSLDRVTQCFLPRRFMDDIVYECSWTGPHTLPHQKIQTFYVLHVALSLTSFYVCVSHVLSIVIGNVMIETCILAGWIGIL